MTGNRHPFIGSGRLKEGGELATRKQDFNAHVQGNGFRHTADNIDMNPPIPALGGTTVQTTLQEITSLIASGGTGFISIGNAGTDGYALGSYNIKTTTTPTLKDAFNAAFKDKRLQNGGIILLLAGTYTTSATIEVPPGITIMGEVGGTLIIGEMSEQSMFLVKQTVKNINVNGNSGGGPTPLNSGSLVEKTKFLNLMLADNLNGNVASGGASMSTVPMISVGLGANFECQNVSFIGRLNNGPVLNRIKTKSAVSMVTGGSSASIMKFDNCFFDALGIAINFNCVLGSLDYLTVTNCRARTYGTEAVASPTSLNTFVTCNLCNINIVNNYYVGAGSQSNTFLFIGTTSGNTAVNVILAGNTGSPAVAGTGQLVVNNSNVSFTSMISGNNWGTDVDSPWFITVGGSSGTEPLGDIFGPGAIDIVFRMANNGAQATVVVNPGTYNIVGSTSVNNFSNLKFIGNKKGKNYPIFNVNLTDVTTDTIGNKFLVIGNYVEAIQFTTQTGAVSIMPTFNATSNTTQSPANTVLVKDCLFTDVTLRLMDIGAGPFTDGSGNTAKLRTVIESCNFRQTGTFTDNISLVVPRADTVKISNCTFAGFGYAMSLGTNSYSSANLQDTTYLITDTTFDLTGATISHTPPTSISANYISITDFSARAVFQNCQILNNNLFNNVASINSSLTNAGTFTKFVYIGARECEITNCEVIGPTQTFISGGVTYVLPTLFIEASNYTSVLNTMFTGGALPLQLGGPNFTSLVGVVIQGCQFNGNNATGQFTQLDIDFDLSFRGGIKPFIRVTNNVFEASSVSNIQVQHTNITGGAYNAQGMVQIYANNYDVVFANNKVGTTIRGPVVNPYSHIAGVVINSYDSTSFISGSLADSVTVHDNNITMSNAFGAGTSAMALWIKAPDIKVHDNYLSVANSALFPSNFIGCLYVDARPTASSPAYSDAIVTGNSFVRRTSAGASSGSFSGGYVVIPSTSGRGVIIDNSFSDPTIDGSSTTVVLDQTPFQNNWRVTQNKNQTEVFIVRGNMGKVMNNGDFVFILFIPVIQSTTNPRIQFWDLPPNNYTLALEYTSAASTLFFWNIPLYDILPKGVRVISVSMTGSCDHQLTSGNFAWSLNATTPGSVNPATAMNFQSPYVANTSIVSTATPGNTSSADTFINLASEALTISMACQALQNAASATVFLDAFVVTYRW